MTPGLTPFAGNDYLGLARDPRLAEACSRAATTHGISSTSSRWALGWTALHQELEESIANFTGLGAACITGAAYFGGAVYYSLFAGSGRTVYCDAMVHSNQYLGMRAAGLEIRPFRHLDVVDLRRQLAAHSGPPPIIASDGVYGISGELAPLAELAAAARAVGAEFFVDDAHGFGALGASGRGSVELCGLAPDSTLTVLCSMSKAMGCGGGFLAGRLELIERCRRSPTASGSAIPPPPIAAACRASLHILRSEPERRVRLQANARRMRQALAGRGIAVVSEATPILGMVFADEHAAAAASRHFAAHAIAIPYFKYASEPRENLLRGIAKADYTEADLQRFENAVLSLPA